MTAIANEIAELHAALTRARAMGFERTAEAMQQVFDEMLANAASPTPGSRLGSKLKEPS